MVKPSLRELSELVGQPLPDEASWIEAGSRLVSEQHAEIVALSLGDRGGILFAKDGIWRSPALPIKPSGTVGAGDSFLGGLTLGLAKGDSVPDAFRLAMGAGSATLLRAGTELCMREDVERFYRDVTVAEISGARSG